MNTTKVVNKLKEPYDVYIGRGSPFGNPYSHLERTTAPYKVMTREESIERYREWFEIRIQDPVFRAQVLGLAGSRLGCFCKPLPCHGDVIKEWLDKHTSSK